MGKTGRGGFLTGTISAVSPLKIRINQRLEISETNLYVTENCIGLKGAHSSTGAKCQIRKPLAVGDGVLLLCRPASDEGSKYVLLDRIQPFTEERSC